MDNLTERKRKAFENCCKRYKLAQNPLMEEIIAYSSCPDKPNKTLALLNLLYKQEATNTSLAAVSTQAAGIIRELRNKGFIFQKGETSNNYLYTNTSKQQCRQIIGYKLPETKVVYSKETLTLLEKAKDAALSAIEIYNGSSEKSQVQIEAKKTDIRSYEYVKYIF